MASECDHAVLLGEESESAPTPVASQLRKRVALGLGFGAVAAVASWQAGVGSSAASPTSVSGIMSAASLIPGYRNTCQGAILANVHWPHAFNDVNWQGHDCSDGDGGNWGKCEMRLVEKYVGDYFDAFVAAVNNKAAEKMFLPDGAPQRTLWKERAVAEMQEFAKSHEKVHIGATGVVIRNGQNVYTGGTQIAIRKALSLPDEFSQSKICDVIEHTRPIFPQRVDVCRPNYAPWESIEKILKTRFPPQAAQPLALGKLAPSLTATFPAELGSTSNQSIESCRSLLRHTSGADWIESSLAVLDMRACLHSGGHSQHRFSRSWVRDCIPRAEIGYPGYVYKFLSEYGAPGDDCIPSYTGVENGHCPSLCQNGESLAGHLKRPDGDYTVIFRGVAGAYTSLDASDHNRAKQHIFNDGPIVGLIPQTKWLAACARDDRILYENDCTPAENNDDEWQTSFGSMHSIVVHGWGSQGGTDYYRAMTSFQDDDHEARINQCAIKFFVIPKTTKGLATSDYDENLQAIRAEARCHRGGGFCTSHGGYTDTEDCDGDGVLDHWCYIVGDEETPTYEAFISSRFDCTTQEKSCRRSVLPGRHFGCQRPLGWCMHGERYYRNVDCDGDGHFDHVCEKAGDRDFDCYGDGKLDHECASARHAGYIASSQDCHDTWEDGTTGLQCEPAKMELAAKDTVPYKLVSDYGNCAPKDGTTCFVSHEEWPNSNYPVGVCQFHVEWTQPPAIEVAKTNCEGTTKPDETLWLEVVQMNIEGAIFNDNGWWYGEQLKVNGINTKTTRNLQTNRNVAEFVPVKDKDIIKWSTDDTVQEAGWLVCLRLKKKIPEVHKATCSEIGDDIWSTYFTTDSPRTVVSVECNEKQCNKAPVKAVEQQKTYTFFITTNVCDAGWQAARSNKFDLSFTGPTTTSEATFEVLL